MFAFHVTTLFFPMCSLRDDIISLYPQMCLPSWLSIEIWFNCLILASIGRYKYSLIDIEYIFVGKSSYQRRQSSFSFLYPLYAFLNIPIILNGLEWDTRIYGKIVRYILAYNIIIILDAQLTLKLWTHIIIILNDYWRAISARQVQRNHGILK